MRSSSANSEKVRTLPAMDLGGRRLADSTAIIAALEERYPEPPLYPPDADERRRAVALEDWFDEELAPYATRLVLHELGRDRESPRALGGEGDAGAVREARAGRRRLRADVHEGPYEGFRTHVRDRPGWRWVQEMFRRHRRRERAPARQDVGAAA